MVLVNRVIGNVVFFKFFVFSSEDGSEFNSDRSSMILGGSDASFLPYDEDLEPLATQEEAAACEANMALEAERELEFQRRFYGRSRRPNMVGIFKIVASFFVSFRLHRCTLL